MIAMVMSAGEGTRLRPMTYVLPKHMAPIANRPALEHTLINLVRCGIRRAVVNLSYKPEMIKSHFHDGEKWGIRIDYTFEKELLGTAGGVKNAEKIIRSDPDPDFLVTSGDGLTDFDFREIIRFHKHKKALGTMALKKVDTRFEYGVVHVSSDSRITKFVEKPSWADIYTNTVNTGIYVFNKEIFKHIPAKSFYDFGKQVWPELLKGRKHIFGYELKSFWTDIGNITEYRNAQLAVLNGKVHVKLNGKQIKPGVWAEEGAHIHPQAELEAPCLIGGYCKIGKNATIANTVVGKGTSIGARARVRNTIIWNDVSIGTGARLENCVVCTKAEAPEGISISDGVLF